MRMVLNEPGHVYQDLDDPDRPYVSVSHVIKRLGLGKTWEGGVDPRRDRAVEFARERGIAVEAVLYALLQGREPDVEVPDWTSDYNGGETLRESVERFSVGVQNWMADTQMEYINSQAIVADKEAGIAGTLDLELWDTENEEGVVVDVKCTSKPETDWLVQVGAYGSMNLDGPERLAVLHINPKFKGGYMWREYDPPTCWKAWRSARGAWIESTEAFARAKMSILEAIERK